MLIDNNKKVSTFKFTDELEVTGVNSKIDLVNLEQQYLRQKAENLLESGTLIRDPARTDIRGNLRVSKNVEIDINCVFEDDVSIGENSIIGHNCFFLLLLAFFYTCNISSRFSKFESIEHILFFQVGKLAVVRIRKIYHRIRPSEKTGSGSDLQKKTGSGSDLKLIQINIRKF